MKFTIAELRARRKLSQEKLAELSGLSAKTIYNYEKDISLLRKAKYETLESLAKALEVSPSEIFLG